MDMIFLTEGLLVRFSVVLKKFNFIIIIIEEFWDFDKLFVVKLFGFF